MKHHNQYIVTKRIKKKVICGEINLPYGTICSAKNNAIYCDKGIICAITSQDAFDYFSQNDDECGILRRKLIDSILESLNRSKQSIESYDEKWERVWNDTICLKYKRPEHEDYWLWGYDFYNADIDVLQHIAKLVEAKEVK